jgi:hypothetical protein
MLEIEAGDGTGEVDLFGDLSHLVRVDVEATGTATVPAEEGPPCHAATTEGAVYTALGEEIITCEPFSHFSPLLSNTPSSVFNAVTYKFSTALCSLSRPFL